MPIPVYEYETGQAHIGDGVYASFDGGHVWLRTERDGGVIHEIALDPDVLRELETYCRMHFNEVGVII